MNMNSPKRPLHDDGNSTLDEKLIEEVKDLIIVLLKLNALMSHSRVRTMSAHYDSAI